MQQVLNYLTSNNLNPIAIYDFQAQSSYSLNSNTLSISNTIANGYTLTSEILLEHPTRLNSGLYFTNNKYLYLLNSNLLSSSNEYSIIFLTLDSTSGRLTMLENIASNHSYPSIEYIHSNNDKFKQSIKSNLLTTSIDVDSSYMKDELEKDIELNFSVVNHDSKYGLTSYSNVSNISGDTKLDNYINFSKSNLNSINAYIDKLTIGSSDSEFILNKLIICSKQLNINQINDVIELLRIAYYSFNIEALNKNNKLSLQGFSSIRLECIFNLIVDSLIWNEINNSHWNSITTTQWNSI